MKKLLFILFIFSFYLSSAQIAFNTGSVQLDSDLNSINIGASANFEAFKGDLAISYNVSEKKIEYLRASVNLAPGEIYLALEIAKLSRRSIDQVVTIYKNNKGKGWGYIAKEAGIKPGSAAFHQLKNNARSKKSKAGNGKGKVKSKGKGPGK